ncbi:YceH family protein [Aurantibacillus circumpalustris]|uniref:YceH family protein n=1 Tax=Aurantibacillus circumpalustris TaxID=3036359 RepID=UPI00295B95CA|nr:YceH family protein [Aurantibacillus circumpalustris]
MDSNKTLPTLSQPELRVLGALIEKSKTTPDYYPMTLNALTAACNQKTSRHPVTNYEEEVVVLALNSLKAQSLIATAVGGGSRVIKYKHNFVTAYEIEPEQLAVLCLLMLRGPQTPGEINTNSARLYEFRSLDEVHSTLNKLASAEPPYLKELAKRPGQKEARYTHLLGDEIIEDTNYENDLPQEPARKHVSELENRVATLEQQLAEVKEILNKITQELF